MKQSFYFGEHWMWLGVIGVSCDYELTESFHAVNIKKYAQLIKNLMSNIFQLRIVEDTRADDYTHIYWS